ncbi:MAG: tetratricopeptide repeat protein, partial [Anaerolineae bacterium]
MTTISLQEYIQQIEQKIEEDRSAEAAMHCRHILQQYPRHIDTYRLYAKSLLEQEEFGAAAEVFQRVLSADPNDFISHVGLSVALKEQAVQPQSHWHLERAFEMQPYNGAIRQELLTSYRQNGESVNEPLPLTPGALARLHFRSEMYAQSAMELRQALKGDQDRVDLEVLLAELLWRDGQRVAAVNLCHRVLDVLPDCISANAILADIWLRTGQIQEAQPFLDHLQSLTRIDAATLNGDTAVGRAFSAVGAPEIPNELMVEYLGEPDASTQPDTAAAIIESEGGEEIDASYDWLTAVESESEMFSEDELDGEWEKPETNWLIDPEADPEQFDVEGEEESADWLTDLDAMTEADDFDSLFVDDEADTETAVAGEIEDAEDALDWLTETTQDDFDAIQLSPEDAVEWMAATDNDLFSESGVDAGADEDSEWLAKLDEADSEFESQPGPTAVGSEAPILPNWLTEAEEPVDVISEAASLPGWLDGEGEGDAEQVEELAGIGDDTLPGWLTDDLEETVVAEAEAGADEKLLPGWLTDEL